MLVLLATAMFGSPVRADTRNEFWPELDVWLTLTKPTRLLLTAAGTRNRDSGDKSDSELAAYLDYRASDRISYRVGYVYAIGLAATPDERDSIEQRVVLDFNYRWRLGEHAQLADRTRVDLRALESEDSHRVRNRLRFETELQVRQVSLTPYASFEAYYDERFATVSRLRLEAGATLPAGRRIELDFYLGRQRDSRPQTEYVNGFGITLNVEY